MYSIKKIVLVFVLLIGLAQNASALTNGQIIKIKVSYKIGSTIKANDGMTFGYTLASILGQESSYGIDNIGDTRTSTGKLKTLYESSLGNYQIRLNTAKIVIMKYKALNKYKYLVNPKETYKLYSNYFNKMNYYKSILKSKIWNNRLKHKDTAKKAKDTLKWANKMYLKYYSKYIHYRKEARKDNRLINKLMYDFSFSSLISGYYLKYCYDTARNKFKYLNTNQIYKKAVGRYNGGWNNKVYYKKVIKRMRTVKTVLNK